MHHDDHRWSFNENHRALLVFHSPDSLINTVPFSTLVYSNSCQSFVIFLARLVSHMVSCFREPKLVRSNGTANSRDAVPRNLSAQSASRQINTLLQNQRKLHRFFSFKHPIGFLYPSISGRCNSKEKNIVPVCNADPYWYLLKRWNWIDSGVREKLSFL